jgi:hypothetical protein
MLRGRGPLVVFGISSIVVGLGVATASLKVDPQGVAGGLATEAAGVLVGSGLIEIALAVVDAIRERRQLGASLSVSASFAGLHHDRLAATVQFTNIAALEIFAISFSFNIDVTFAWIDYRARSGPAVSMPEEIPEKDITHITRLLPGETLHASVEYDPTDVYWPQVACRWSVAGESRKRRQARFARYFFLPNQAPK